MSRIFVILAVVIGVAIADHHLGGESVEAAQDASQPWIGKWKSTGRQENWEAFQTALQVPMAQHGNDEVFHKLWKEGDHYHHRISVPSKNYKNEVQFKLGEEGTSNFNNTEFKYKYAVEADGLHTTFTIPSKNKVINDIYKVNGDELEKTYKVDDVVAKKWYSRVKASA